VELCWWFDEASVQFRIAGRGLIADSTTQDLQEGPNADVFKATAALLFDCQPTWHILALLGPGFSVYRMA
jgi:hypothetical protein